MFGNGIPEQLPPHYGEIVPVTKWTQYPGSTRAAAKFVHSAAGVVLPPIPTGIASQVEILPASLGPIMAIPQRHPGKPYAPQPPYVGGLLSKLVSNTPFSRGQGVPITVLPPATNPYAQGIVFPKRRRKRGKRPSFGAVGAFGGANPPWSPLGPGDTDGILNRVSRLSQALNEAGHPHTVTEEWNEELSTAIGDFQTAQGLTVTGNYDSATEDALNKALGKKSLKKIFTETEWGEVKDKALPMMCQFLPEQFPEMCKGPPAGVEDTRKPNWLAWGIGATLVFGVGIWAISGAIKNTGEK